MIALRRPSVAASATTAASVATLLTSCRTLRDLEQIHALIIHKGLEQHHVLINRFITHCSALSTPRYASAAFSRVSRPNLHLWNALIKSQSSLPAALPLLNLMRRRGHHPDAFTFPPLLKSCSLLLGASLHCAALRCGVAADVFVATALIDFYGKCDNIIAARLMFDTMPHRNLVSYTAMIVGYINHGELGSARDLFDAMPERNVVSWNAMIDGYVKSRDLVAARKLFDEMPERNLVSVTSMIDGYTKAGDMASARLLFDQSEDRDVFSWSAMISGYARIGRPGEALKMFLEMHKLNVRPDEYIVVGLISACSQLGSLALAKWVDSYVARSSVDVKRAHVLAALIDMNAKSGNMERAALLFESMPNRDLFSYCSMMQGYSIHGLGAQAVELFSRMLKEGLIPDEVAFTVVLTACSHAGLVEEGNKYFELMKNEYLMNPSLDHYACMVDLYGRSGRLEEAYELIKTMPVETHAGAWGALLGACWQHGGIHLAEIVATHLFEIEPQNAGNYVSLSNIYAADNRWADVSELRTMMSKRGVKKIPGSTWIYNL